MSTYAIAKGPAPLYNTLEFPHHQNSLKTDHQGLIKEIEVIVFPSTKFIIQKELSNHVSEVKTADYSSSKPLYIDNRFLHPATEMTPERTKKLHPPESILEFMQSLVGVRYFWGGNWASGISEMSSFYPQLLPSDDLICKGIDCSGLLYQATNGYTPRNTSELFTYGKELQVDLSSPSSVQENVKPLDMMVWKGHVVFFLDQDHLIESTVGKGVIISDFTSRYVYFQEKLQSENKPFSIRRWHPEII